MAGDVQLLGRGASPVKIVSVSPYMPFSGIPHAGGEYYRRHAELASRTHDFVVICPDNPDNEAAVGHEQHTPYRRLLVTPEERRGRLGHAAASFLARLVPFLGTRAFGRALLVDTESLSELRSADRIELQWFDSVVLASKLRRAFPKTPIIGVFHDVVSQEQSRMLWVRRLRLKGRCLALVRLVVAIPLEARAMRVIHKAVVLSEKDRRLLERRGSTAGIVVVAPPLVDEGMPAAPRIGLSGPPEVLFVGALWRYENEDAALWLLRDIWPEVRAAVPSARLTIAGAGPTPRLEEEVARHPDVVLTGYVKSLKPYYERACVVVAPMRLGAGVKLKSVVAMLWGVPVVATSTGAEGVAGTDVFLAVEERSPCFSRAVIEALVMPSSTADVRTRAYKWSHDTYSEAGYLRSLASLYA